MIAGLIAIIVGIFFAWSLFNTLKMIPAKYHRFPVWFSWLIIIPVVGLIFLWLILPFGLPNAIKKSEPDNPAAQKTAKTMFGLGLAAVILMTVSALLGSWGITPALASLVLMIIYWVQVIQVRKTLNLATIENI